MIIDGSGKLGIAREPPRTEMKERIIKQTKCLVFSLGLQFSVVEENNFVNLINNFDPVFAVPPRIKVQRRHDKSDP